MANKKTIFSRLGLTPTEEKTSNPHRGKNIFKGLTPTAEKRTRDQIRSLREKQYSNLL